MTATEKINTAMTERIPGFVYRSDIKDGAEKIFARINPVIPASLLAKNSSDCSEMGLALAWANGERTGMHWCSCGSQDEAFYERKEENTHGYVCRSCAGIAQVG